MTLILAVHGGAGNHPFNQDIESQTKKGLRQACIRAQNSFKDTQDICLAVRDSIMLLEDDPCFNAGTGSNLTMDGEVECDASIMNGEEDFGAVGAMTGFKNPIAAAHTVLVDAQTHDAHGRIPPMLLAGSSSSITLPTINPSSLVTPRASSDWKRWKELIQIGQPQEFSDDAVPQDTVGSIACTIDGAVSAGVSSGGILLKRSGRVGEAGTFGAGCWASGARGDLNAVACSISGTGEMIMRACLAKELGEAIRRPGCDVHEQMEHTLTKFKEMCARRKSEHTNAGIILIVVERQQDGEVKPRLWCGFTTPSFAVGYSVSAESTPKATILRRPNQNSLGLYITSLPLDA